MWWLWIWIPSLGIHYSYAQKSQNRDFQVCLFNMKYRNKYKYSAGVRRHSGRFNVQGLQYKQKQLDV